MRKSSLSLIRIRLAISRFLTTPRPTPPRKHDPVEYGLNLSIQDPPVRWSNSGSNLDEFSAGGIKIGTLDVQNTGNLTQPLGAQFSPILGGHGPREGISSILGKVTSIPPLGNLPWVQTRFPPPSKIHDHTMGSTETHFGVKNDGFSVWNRAHIRTRVFSQFWGNFLSGPLFWHFFR